MPRSSRELPVALLRKLLLAAMAVFLIAVGVVFLRGRLFKGPPIPAPEVRERSDSEESLVLAGEGFDYELTQGGRKVFHIKAQRIVSQREDEYSLEGVEIDLAREDGTEYYVSGDLGSYDIETQRSRIDGDVVLRAPREVELRSQGLELRRKAKLLVSNGPVDFDFLGRFTGRANRMRVNSRSNNFTFAGNVEIDTLPGDVSPLSLRCQRFSYDRDQRLMRTEGDVVLQRGNDELRARRLTLTLSEDEKTVRFVRALWDVTGGKDQPSDDGLAGRLRFDGWELSVVFEEENNTPLTAELEGGQGDRAVLSWSDGAGLTRRIRSDYLVGDFEQGNLRQARAFEQVEIDEFISFVDGPPLRRICAGTADAVVLADGSLGLATLEDEVDLEEGSLQAHGEQMTADGVDGTVELVGDLAWAMNDRGRMESPRMVYSREEGTIRAVEGVTALLEGEDRIALSEAAGDQPIRVQAREAEWSGPPSQVLFRDQVRAWQGENFLLADELLGEAEGSRLTASGNVRTVWRPEPDKKAAPGGEKDKPLQVTAQKMVYERDQRLLTFSGGSRADQEGRTLRCTELLISENEEGGFEKLTCEGAAQLEDPAAGKTVTGERVVYLPGESSARVTGSPVTMRDVNGTQIRGHLLIYDLESGTAQIQIEPETEPQQAAAEPDETPQ